MSTFSIEGDCRSILTRLFEVDQDGQLWFGWSGNAIHATHEDLLARPIRFRDYIMEGFVFYSVLAEDLGPGCLLSVQGEGSNRDWSIYWQVRHYIKAAGLTILNEAEG